MTPSSSAYSAEESSIGDDAGCVVDGGERVRYGCSIVVDHQHEHALRTRTLVQAVLLLQTQSVHIQRPTDQQSRSRISARWIGALTRSHWSLGPIALVLRGDTDR